MPDRTDRDRAMLSGGPLTNRSPAAAADDDGRAASPSPAGSRVVSRRRRIA